MICVLRKASSCPVTLSQTRAFISFVNATGLNSFLPALFRTLCSLLSPQTAATERSYIMMVEKMACMDHGTALRSPVGWGYTCCSSFFAAHTAYVLGPLSFCFVPPRMWFWLSFNEQWRWSTGAGPADDILDRIRLLAELCITLLFSVSYKKSIDACKSSQNSSLSW
jgi:hypothetical protein